MSYWGPHEPDAAQSRFYFKQHFPDFTPTTTIAAVGPGTAATLLLQLVDDLTLRWSFQTSVFKSYSGLEKRAGNHTLPSSSYDGVAQLAGNDAPNDRAVLAKYAAAGVAFLLGLPFEELTLVASASGTTVNVAPGVIALSDWVVPGQRVLVASADGTQVVQAVVQSSGSTTIALDVAPGSVGNAGGRIMPAVPVLLDGQQNFVRQPAPLSLEDWQVKARNVMFGYETPDSTAAFAVLSGLTGGSLHSATAVFLTPGTIGNGASLTLVGDSALTHGQIALSGQAVTFHFKPATTTLQDLLTALASQHLIGLIGTLPALTTALQNTDAFGPANLAGGTDKSWGAMGSGATVNAWQGRPVWDRGIDMPGGSPVGDSLLAMADLVDLGGVPFEQSTATQPDLGRQVILERATQADWQWLKAMLYAVNGCRRAFWLPTWRADLSPVSLAPGLLTIDPTVGDYTAWVGKRTEIQFVDASGNVQYLHVTGWSTSGGNAVASVTSSNPAYNSGGGGTTILAAATSMVSWMDLCRFEKDTFEVKWRAHLFTFVADARAVAQ